MRLARSVVALAIVLATTTSHMTRTTYAEDATYAEVTATTAVTTSFTSTTKPTTEKPLATFTASMKDAAETFMAPPPPPPAPVNVQPVHYAHAPGVVAGNSYAYGTCTWYVKNRVPAWPNAMGNANQWVYSAQANGIATGGTPAVGAIAAENGIMHVAYVEWVSPDKQTVKISEMNYAGSTNVHYRTVPASTFTYIYM